MNRRQLLGWLGSLGTVGFAGCGSDSPGDSPRNGSPATTDDPTTSVGRGRDPRRRVRSTDPETVAAAWGLDEVAHFGELGADADAGRPIDDLLERHATDGTLLYLPPGEYAIEETFSVGSGGERIGLLGDDASIVPPDGFDTVILALGYPEHLSAVFVRGITFDFGAENTGGRPIFAGAEDLVLFRDVAVSGVADVQQDLMRLDVSSPDGRGIVDRLQLPDGSTEQGVTGCEVGDANEGDVTFHDCYIEGFPDNGLYADPPEGSIGVYGGFYRNNGVGSVRITTSEPSVVRGVHVRCDDADAVGQNLRGIRLRGGHSHLVEDCVVEMLAVPSSDGAITIASELESATVRNCRLHVDADGVNGLRVKQPADGAGESTQSGPFRFENVRITGDASGGAAVQASGRQDCSFRGLQVFQSGDDRDGIVTTDVQGELVDSCVSVTNDPLALSDSTIERRNVWLHGDTAGSPEGV